MKPKNNAKNNTKELYTVTDVRSVRTGLLAEQKYLDAVTGLPLSASDAVLDHDHSSQLVRGVLHRQSNVMLGKIENSFKRYMKYWYEGSLSDFLSQCSEYLSKQETNPETRWYHPGWIKKIQTEFNKLPSKAQDSVLVQLGSAKGKNSTERKLYFKKQVLSKEHSYTSIMLLIDRSRKESE